MSINFGIFIIECFALTLAFTGMIMIPLYNNPIWWIHDYPKDIQEEYFKSHDRIPTEHMDKAYYQKKYHFVHSIIGMGLGLIPCLLCGVIVMMI